MAESGFEVRHPCLSRWGRSERATILAISTPDSTALDPSPCFWTQVLSRLGCTAVRLRNHLCFGRCSSLYVPGVDPTPLVLCNSCVPSHRRWASVVLWCRVGSPASHRRVKTSTVLVEECQCSPEV